MDNKRKSNKVMFYAGIAFTIISAVLLYKNLMGESAFPIILGVVGIIFIGASKFRMLK